MQIHREPGGQKKFAQIQFFDYDVEDILKIMG